MKKSRDILGEIVKGIVAVGIIVSVISAIEGFSSRNITVGFISIGAFISCFFVYWLVSAISKISTNINDIKQNSDIVSAYYRQIMQNQYSAQNYQQQYEQNVPVPTNTENNV